MFVKIHFCLRDFLGPFGLEAAGEKNIFFFFNEKINNLFSFQIKLKCLQYFSVMEQ